MKFDATSIAAVLTAWKPMPKRAAGAPAPKEVEQAYGGAVSSDLRVLLALSERRTLPRLRGGWRLLGDAKAMLPPRSLSVKTDLLGPLCAVYPIANNGGDDAAYATLRPAGDPRSWIYFFEGSESESLTRCHYSIAHFIYTHTRPEDEDHYDSLFGTEDEASQAFADRESRWEFEPLEDPSVLRERSRWLSDALRGNRTDALKRAPSLADWQSERDWLADAPHLALYWLLAHWLLGNESARLETDALVASSSNVWVKAARGWVATEAPPIAVELRERAPAKTLQGPRTKATIAPKSSLDPVAQMASAPADQKLHAKVLKEMAKSSDAAFREHVNTYLALAAGMSSFDPGKATQQAWVLAIDERMLIPAIGLVLRSYRYPSWKSEYGLRTVIGALGRLGPTSPHRKLALDTLLAAPIDAHRLDGNRLAEVARALGPFAEPRGAAWLVRCANAGIADRLDAWGDEAAFAALDALASFDRPKAEAIVARALSTQNRAAQACHGGIANVARTHAMKAVAPALRTAYSVSGDAPAELGMALAVLAPKGLRERVLREAREASRVLASDPGALRGRLQIDGDALRLHEHAEHGLVATLLVLDKHDAEVLALCKKLLGSRAAAPTMLRALGIAGAVEQLALVRKCLHSPDSDTREAAQYALARLSKPAIA